MTSNNIEAGKGTRVDKGSYENMTAARGRVLDAYDDYYLDCVLHASPKISDDTVFGYARQYAFNKVLQRWPDINPNSLRTLINEWRSTENKETT